MDRSELLAAGIARQAELVADGSVSSRELTEACLERIEALQPKLNAFRIVLAEQARESADEADRRLAAGERAPLLGVPVAIKDGVDVAGELTTHGTLGFTTLAREDAAQVAKLRAAGAVVVGKTNLPELAICGFTETEAWGITRNPWDLDHTSGGSSGGSAAAVAAATVRTGAGRRTAKISRRGERGEQDKNGGRGMLMVRYWAAGGIALLLSAVAAAAQVYPQGYAPAPGYPAGYVPPPPQVQGFNRVIVTDAPMPPDLGRPYPYAGGAHSGVLVMPPQPGYAPPRYRVRKSVQGSARKHARHAAPDDRHQGR